MGRPVLVGDKAVYMVSAEDFAAAAEKIHSAGVSIIGGCCGAGQGHIEAMAKKMARWSFDACLDVHLPKYEYSMSIFLYERQKGLTW
jgi:hypothetical protein